MTPSAPQNPRRIPSFLAAILAACGAAFTVGDQPAHARQPTPDVLAPAPFSGRDFANVDFPSSPQALAMTFSAARAWTWREDAAARFYFERDVRVTIGPYRFVADRVTAWIEPVTVNGVAADQVALYLDNARDPAGPGEGGRPVGGGGTWLSQSASRLLVTALLTSNNQPWTVRADVPVRDGRPASAFIAEGEARLARYLVSLTTQPEPETAPGQPTSVAGGGLIVTPEAGASRSNLRAADATARAEADPLPPAVGDPPRGADGRDLTIDTRPRSPIAVRTAPVAPRDGLVEFYCPEPRLVDVPPEQQASAFGAKRAFIMEGGLTVRYDTVGRRQSVQLAAARGVVFLSKPPDAGAGLRLAADDVLGVYLEGDVEITARTQPDPTNPARPDQYVLRGSRVYYDLKRNSAIVLDAVFWTYDQERGMPLYLRADTLRQKSLREFQAQKATLANVSFAEPHFAIGASSVTVTRDTASDGRALNTYDARDVVFTAGGVPLAYLPKVSGEFKPSPLRRIEFERVADTTAVRTVWDMYTILGQDAPAGNRWDLLVDAYLERGPGVGTDFRFTRPDADLNFLGYYIHDNGEDHFSSGAERDAPQENRGILEADAVFRLDEHWTLFAEGSYISDEAFIDSFFRSEAETRREYTNSIYVRRLEDNELISAEARASFNDFIANQYLLQSLGYQTEKLPEFKYARVGEDLFSGLISYTGEAAFASENLNFDEPTLATRGYDTRDRAGAGFDLLPTDRLGRVLREQGYDEDTVTRFDTRHDFEAPLSVGPVNVVPFAVGRATAYDTNFSTYNQGEGNDRERYWGSTGLRAATSLTKTDSDARNEALDLTGLRHIVTPSLTAYTSGTNVEQQDLPNYDEDVESLADGSAVRLGLNQTWQTHRPGASPATRGQLRSVDWIKLNTDYVWSSGDVDLESPFGRFIEARPERSNFGKFFTADTIIQVTDAVAITADVLYDADENTTQRVATGLVFDHGFGFSTFTEYRYADPLASSFLDLGAKYELTRKYAVTLQGVYDVGAEEFQSVGGRLIRRFPQWTVEMGFSVSTITDEFNFGLVFSPVGASGEDRRRILTREFDDTAPTPAQRDAARDRFNFGPFAD